MLIRPTHAPTSVRLRAMLMWPVVDTTYPLPDIAGVGLDGFAIGVRAAVVAASPLRFGDRLDMPSAAVDAGGDALLHRCLHRFAASDAGRWSLGLCHARNTTTKSRQRAAPFAPGPGQTTTGPPMLFIHRRESTSEAPLLPRRGTVRTRAPVVRAPAASR